MRSEQPVRRLPQAEAFPPASLHSRSGKGKKGKKGRKDTGEIISPVPPWFCLPAAPVRQVMRSRLPVRRLPQAEAFPPASLRTSSFLFRPFSFSLPSPPLPAADSPHTVPAAPFSPACRPQLPPSEFRKASASSLPKNSGNPLLIHIESGKGRNRCRPPQAGATAHVCTAYAAPPAEAFQPALYANACLKTAHRFRLSSARRR